MATIPSDERQFRDLALWAFSWSGYALAGTIAEALAHLAGQVPSEGMDCERAVGRAWAAIDDAMEAMGAPFTIESIGEAMKGYDWWLEPESFSARVVGKALSAGYLRRISHTQIEWTNDGLAKARRELAHAEAV